MCPTDAAVANLAREGITAGVHQVGDVMLDASRMFAPGRRRPAGPARRSAWTPGGYLLVTVHRAAATDTPEALAALVDVLEAIDEPAVFPVHPRTRHRLEEAGLWERLERAIPPCACRRRSATSTSPRCCVGARAVVTDSGGVQKEAYFHGVPCVTLRDTTEWVETVEGGFNRLVGMDAASGCGRPWPTCRCPPSARPSTATGTRRSGSPTAVMGAAAGRLSLQISRSKGLGSMVRSRSLPGRGAS